jgi:AMMECR1 domain-containing protein
MVVGDIREETGAASQDLRGRPLSAGQVTFSVAVLETLTPITVPDALVVSDVDVTGYGRDTVTLPTT